MPPCPPVLTTMQSCRNLSSTEVANFSLSISFLSDAFLLPQNSSKQKRMPPLSVAWQKYTFLWPSYINPCILFDLPPKRYFTMFGEEAFPFDLQVLKSFKCLRPLKMVSRVPSKFQPRKKVMSPGIIILVLSLI